MTGESASSNGRTNTAEGFRGRLTGPPAELCPGCAPSGACQFGVRALRLDADGSATAEVFFGGDNEGGPGVAHGGWTAGMFDEVLGLALNRQLRMPAVTRDLNVQYLRPVPIGRRLLVEAWGERLDDRGRWRMHGRLVLASSGAELGSASGVWVERDASHFQRHQQWLRDQDGLGG